MRLEIYVVESMTYVHKITDKELHFALIYFVDIYRPPIYMRTIVDGNNKDIISYLNTLFKSN